MGKLILFPGQKPTPTGELEKRLQRKRLLFALSFLGVLTVLTYFSEHYPASGQRDIASVDERWSTLKDGFQNYRFETQHILSEIEFVEGDLTHAPRVMKADEMLSFAVSSKTLWRFPYDEVEALPARGPASETTFRLVSNDGTLESYLHFQINHKNQVERIYQSLH